MHVQQKQYCHVTLYCRDLQEKAIEGPAASDDEAEKFWLFTLQLLDTAEKTSKSDAVEQVDVAQAGQGDQESKKTKQWNS